MGKGKEKQTLPQKGAAGCQGWLGPPRCLLLLLKDGGGLSSGVSLLARSSSQPGDIQDLACLAWGYGESVEGSERQYFAYTKVYLLSTHCILTATLEEEDY